MTEKLTGHNAHAVENMILTVRGQKAILDADLARIYGVPTKRLNEQVATGSAYGGRRYLPYAFTEHGAIMAANVLNIPPAVQMSVFVVRAFIKCGSTC